MIVYRDIITGDEVLSDAFPLKEVEFEGEKVNSNYFSPQKVFKT